ncbi:MAG: cysteine desulfurase NifS [Oscillospiraceae bacterium]|nr:cysteine desulfurase NifS [Oscillospiraceae bacterium]
MKRFVYADNAATTQISDPVLGAMLPYLKEHYGNPSSIYSLGRDARRAIETARQKTAAALNASPAEIYFTGSGTEADNWALKSTLEVLLPKGKNHIITTNFEHHAILHTCKHLERQGCKVTYLPVNQEGYVTPEQVKAAITPETALVTIMYANNEIGTIQPIPEIGKVCREAGVLFHTDAVQAVGNVPIDVEAQCIDMLSLSGHKIHAPKGVGALYVRKGIRMVNLLDGGAQERNHRGGTENLTSLVGLGTAMENACAGIPERAARVARLRDRLIDGILSEIPCSRLNGGREQRLPGNVNISFEAVEGEALLLRLDMNGICGSSGSACTSGSLDPSHVLMAIGLPHEIAHGSLRLSLNEYNTDEDVDYILQTLPGVIQYLRAMSPLWKPREA